MPIALIVEDEPAANRLLAMLLQLRGYETVSAFSGVEAIETVHGRAPDVVFLDLMLPDMSGFQVCQALKSSGPARDVPVVIVTARLTATNRIESFEAGADDYVSKPYTPDQIFESLERSLGWKDDLDAPRLEGEVPLDAREGGETLRGLARACRLLRSRANPGASEVGRVMGLLKELWASADAWSRGHEERRAATLAYALARGELTLTVRGEPGWLNDGGAVGRDVLSRSRAAGFDGDRDPAGDVLKLSKRWGEGRDGASASGP